MKCWWIFFHKWGKWELGRKSGGHLIVRQCKECGRHQIEYL